jgi:hypothetical protein
MQATGGRLRAAEPQPRLCLADVEIPLSSLTAQVVHQQLINSDMSNETPNIPRHDLESLRWCVKFAEFRCRDEHQVRAIEEVGIFLAHKILRAWLAAVTPDAHVIEAHGTPVQNVHFRRRSDARRFISCWGGRIDAVSSDQSEFETSDAS